MPEKYGRKNREVADVNENIMEINIVTIKKMWMQLRKQKIYHDRTYQEDGFETVTAMPASAKKLKI